MLTSLRAAPLNGDSLTITGDSELQGNNLTFGTANTSDPGLSFTYADGTTATITMTSARNAINWEWYHNSGSGAVISMKLDANNQLLLYNAAGTTAGITLNPTGTSAFVNGITIGGSPVLTSTAAAATYLTISTADTTYQRKVTGPSASASSTGFAFGPVANASGSYAVALGAGSVASGSSSLALGSGNASGFGALAIGGSSAASGTATVATGQSSIASAPMSVAMGYWTQASGDFSFAVGDHTKAQSFSQAVVGRYNIAQGNSSAWIATDDLFIVGNGTADNARSNAFTVKKNGDAIFTGTVRVPPRGDVSMGEFTAE